MQQKRLGFGWMRLPLTDPNDEAAVDIGKAKELADAFIGRGFTYFDTAYMYHEYRSESILRECVTARYPRDSFTVATKMPMIDLEKEEDQARIYAEQKEKIGVDFFDFYLLHNLNSKNYPKAKRFGTIDFLREKREKGEIKQLGFSFHDTPEYLDQILTENPDMDFVQLQINYLDWENAGIQSRRCYETARRHGKEIVVMEPCKGGTLAEVPPAAEARMKAAHPDWSVASWAFRFAAGLPGVRMVLSGMSSLAQLTDNMRTIDHLTPLTAEDEDVLRAVREILNGTGVIRCTGCHYCVEGGSCPKNLAIPVYFSLYNADIMDANDGWSPQEEYYRNLVAQGHGRAGDCIGCRRCERACPQQLPVSRLMKKVSLRFDEGIRDGQTEGEEA